MSVEGMLCWMGRGLRFLQWIRIEVSAWYRLGGSMFDATILLGEK